MVRLRRINFLFFGVLNAGVAQQVEQLICNQQVAGSNPIASSISNISN